MTCRRRGPSAFVPTVVPAAAPGLVPNLVRGAVPVLALSLVAAGCVVPIDVAGGPQRASHRLRPDHIGEDLRPLVADDEAARERLDEVQRRASVSRVALWTGFGLLAGCLAVSMASTSAQAKGTGGTSDATLYGLIGLCGASIAAEVVSIVVAPSKHTWGDPLRVYNTRRPQTPWRSVELEVESAAQPALAEAKVQPAFAPGPGQPVFAPAPSLSAPSSAQIPVAPPPAYPSAGPSPPDASGSVHGTAMP